MKPLGGIGKVVAAVARADVDSVAEGADLLLQVLDGLLGLKGVVVRRLGGELRGAAVQVAHGADCLAAGQSVPSPRCAASPPPERFPARPSPPRSSSSSVRRRASWYLRAEADRFPAGRKGPGVARRKLAVAGLEQGQFVLEVVEAVFVGKGVYHVEQRLSRHPPSPRLPSDRGISACRRWEIGG